MDVWLTNAEKKKLQLQTTVIQYQCTDSNEFFVPSWRKI